MNQSTPGRGLRICIAVLILLVWLPFPVGRLLDGTIAQLVIPVTEPLTRLSVTLRPPVPEISDDHPDLIRLKTENDRSKARIAYLEDRVTNLLSQLRELSSLYEEDATYHYLAVRRATRNWGTNKIGPFKINAGRKHGVEIGVVAMTLSRQLIGRVESVDNLTSTVKPVTDSTIVSIKVRIEAGEPGFDDDIQGSIQPDGTGSFWGDFNASAAITTGAAVRLDDESWGSSNTGLLVGYVENIKNNDDNPLHVTVYVKPSVEVHRLGEVYLKIPESIYTSVTNNNSRSGGDDQ